MSEELLQRDLKNPPKFGRWDFYNIGATSIKSLKENNIIHNFNYGGEEKKKVDALLVQKKNVIAVIEYKKPSEFKTEEQKNKAIKQELDVARKLKAKIFIATDTKESVWINVATGNRIKDESNKELKINFNPKDEKLPDLFEKIIISINEKNDQIKPKELVNPTDLAKQIWQDIWSVSGATPENCLYTFVELFIFKYLSDLEVLKGIFNFYTLYDNYEHNTSEEVLENYANIIRPKIKELFKENSIDHTTIINGTIFVSKDQKAVKGYSTVFKKILKKFKDYGKLENIDYDFKSKLFESFLKESISKKNWGQFFTPLKVVRAIVEMAKDDIKENITICDPACGVGKFLLEPIITQLDRFYKIKNNKLIPKITIHGFDKGFDKDEQKTIILAKANMLIYFSDLIKDNPNLTSEFSNLFNESFLLKTNSILGTLADPVSDEYDLILTNPPYVTSGSSNLKDEIKKDGELENHYLINAMGVEGLFMEWIIRALKPNGKAFIIVPNGLFERQNDKNIRQFILNECFLDGIISLPTKTFFTTPQKTYILCLTKKTIKNEIQTDPVFTYIVSEIGESRDIYRFNIEQDDLSEAVSWYNQFKNAKKTFRFNDKRCKMQPIEKFTSDERWLFEDWWSKEEKIELRIESEINNIKFIDFPNTIEDTINNVQELKEEALYFLQNNQIENIADLENIKTEKIKNIFDIFKGKAIYTNQYIVANKGEFPLYSSQTKNNGIIGNINNYDFDCKALTWTTDGIYAGTVFLRDGKFSMTTHCGALLLKNSNILLEYVYFYLKENLRNFAVGDQNKRVTTDIIKNIEIPIPIDSKGNFDIKKQEEIAKKYAFVDKMKEDLKNQINNLINIKIEL